MPLPPKGDTIAPTLSSIHQAFVMPARNATHVLLLALLSAAGVAHAQAEAAKAADDCEAAVTESVKRMRGKDAQDVQYIKTKRAITPSAEDETSLKGEGRYRGPGGRIVPFSYGCAINTKTGATSGVVFRELVATADDKPFQPDLSHVSVADCDSAAVATLKRKNPRAGHIMLDGESRQLRPADNERIALEGRGAFERAPGMHSAPFTYRCELEPRSGRILSVQTSG
ncbi:MAG: hypothetical protein HS106_06425 [Ideonella sp.]|nr:hypothetical protein [Ideonella sp.]